MIIAVTWELDTIAPDPIAEFICEAIITGLSTVAIELAPELAGLDILGETDLKTGCSKQVSGILND